MEQDQVFRNVLIFCVLLILPFGIYHRVRSQRTGEALDRRQEGWFILATLRPVGLSIWLGLLAWMIEPRSMAWSSVPLPAGVRWTGVGMLAMASALLVWTFRSLGKNLTDTVVTRQSHSLVVHGPYRWVRHPFYDCALLSALAISLVAANWYICLAGVALFGLFVIRTRTEERNLVARFGEGYRTYMERTGRFLPAMGTTKTRMF